MHLCRIKNYAVLLAICVFCIQAGAVTVDIAGLSGAQHWVWVEAEQASSSGGVGSFYDHTAVSGWFGNPDRWGQASSPSQLVWNVHLPAAMTDATAYLRYGVERAKTGNTLVLGSSSVLVNMNTPGNAPTNFTSANTGAQSAGDTTLTIAKSAGYLGWWYFDGFFVADGEITTGLTASVGGQYDRYWMTAPTSVTSHEISGAVLPTITVSGTDADDRIVYLLDGEVYVPGTEIGAGDHSLVISVFADSTKNSNRLAFTGANFTVTVPEPASMAIVTLGALGIIASKRRK